MSSLHKHKPSNGQTWATFVIAAIILSFIAVSSGYFNITGFQFGGGTCFQSVSAVNSLLVSAKTGTTITVLWNAPDYTNTCSSSKPTYDLRYSIGSIQNDADYNGATQFGFEPSYDSDSNIATQETAIVGSCTGINCVPVPLLGCRFYNIAIKSTMGSFTSPLSNVVTAYTTGSPTAAPANPVATKGTGKVTLTWSAPTTPQLCGMAVTNYEIYRATAAGGQGQNPTYTIGNVLTYTDTDVNSDTTYYYKLKVKTGGGTSAFSGEVNAKPDAGIVAPGAPTLISATSGDKQVTLSWSAPASTGGAAITSYKIYRGTVDGVVNTLVHTTPDGATTSYTETGLTNAQTYYYKVSAVNSAGEGTKSNQFSATPNAPSVTACSDGTVYGQCSSNKPKYCDANGFRDNATVCNCPTGQTASGNACTAAPTTPTEPTTPTTPTQPTEPTQPSDGTTGGLEQPQDFNVLEGKARGAINVAESAIKVAKDDKKDISEAAKLYNEAVSAYNSEEYQTAVDKAKAATDAAQQAKLLEAPSAELPITAIVALLVVIAVGGGVVYYYKNVYKKAQGATGTPETEPQTPTQRSR